MSINKEDNPSPIALLVESTRIKAAGMLDVLSDSIKNFKYNGDTNQAAAISLYTILSAIPLFILTIIAASHVFSAYPQIPAGISETFRGLSPYFSERLLNQLGQIESKKNLLGGIGVLGLIWASTAIFNAVETSLNVTFRSREKRNYFVSKLTAVFMIPLVWFFIAASMALSSAAALLLEHPLRLPGGIMISLTTVTGNLLRYVIPYFVSVVLFYFIYRIIPTMKVKGAVLLSGSAIFSLLMEIARQCFTWYIANYTRYGIIFGTFEPIILLIIWVFYVALIFLFCAEVMSSFQRRDMILLEKAIIRQDKKYLKVDERLFKKFGYIYPKDSLVFKEGDEGSQMFYILSGRVALEKDSCQIKKLLTEMGPGQYFGEMAALINAPRTASARTIEDSNLAVIDGELFSNLIRESSDVSMLMLKEFSSRLKNTSSSLEELNNLWIRLAAVIYFIENPNSEVDKHLLELARLTQKLPVEIEEVIRDLARQDIIELKEGHLVKVLGENIWRVLERDTFKVCMDNPQDVIV